MALVIHGSSRSRTMRVLWMAAELGLDYEHDPIAFDDPALKSAAFLALNPAGAIPTSSQVLGPVSDAAAVCSADSVQSVSPAPRHVGSRPDGPPVLHQSGSPTGSGMVGFGRQYRKGQAG